jgi:hypothetical protein
MYMSKSEWMGSMSGSRTHFVNKAKYLLVAFLFLTPYIDGVALQASPTPSTQQSNATPAAQKSTAQKPAQKGAVQPAARQPVKEGASGASNQEKSTAKYLQAVCSLRRQLWPPVRRQALRSSRLPEILLQNMLAKAPLRGRPLRAPLQVCPSQPQTLLQV